MFIKETLRFQDSRIVDPEKFAVNSNSGMNLNFENQCWHSTCIFSLLRISSSETEGVLLFQTFSTQIPRLMTSFNLIWFYLSKKETKTETKPHSFTVLPREMSFHFTFNGDTYHRMPKAKGSWQRKYHDETSCQTFLRNIIHGKRK